jgi:quinone-modifying oxidoreductase subunit QmoC
LTAQTMSKQRSAPPSFLESVIALTPGDSRLEMCIQCGTCSGSCPSGPDMDHSPRQIFAMIRADMREEVFASNTAWYCVSCYFCMVRCPQEVHITDIMYSLKSLAIEAKQYEENSAADLSQTFVGFVEGYGRSFEFGLATRHYLRHQPLSLFGKAQLGLGMLRKNRLELRPHKIDGIDSLQAILDKAKALEKENMA